MGFRTLTISDEAYRNLQRLKARGESFTEVILRITEGRGDLLRYAGGWGDMTDEEAREFEASLREMWSRWKPRMSA